MMVPKLSLIAFLLLGCIFCPEGQPDNPDPAPVIQNQQADEIAEPPVRIPNTHADRLQILQDYCSEHLPCSVENDELHYEIEVMMRHGDSLSYALYRIRQHIKDTTGIDVPASPYEMTK